MFPVWFIKDEQQAPRRWNPRQPSGIIPRPQWPCRRSLSYILGEIRYNGQSFYELTGRTDEAYTRIGW